MVMKTEPTSNELQLLRLLDDPEISPTHREILKRYDLEADKNEGLAIKTRLSRIYPVVQMARNIKKPFKGMSRKDIENYVYALKLAPGSMDLHKIYIRNFFKWFFQSETYPENVKWIKLQNNKKRKLPEDILTVNEIRAMIDAADNPRDRALVSIMYESGARLGEIVGLKQKDVIIDQYGAVLLVHGKTGDRRIRLINSAPDLTLLLNEHPNKGSEKPLFVNYKNTDEPVGARRIQVLIELLAKRAKLGKHVYPHLFRHTRSTHLAKDFTESELKVMQGWSGDSRMPSVYIHLSGADVEKKILEKAGLIDKEESRKQECILKPRECPRCKEINPATAKFCFKCGMALDLQTAMKIENEDSGMMLEFMELMKREPRFFEIMKGISEKK